MDDRNDRTRNSGAEIISTNTILTFRREESGRLVANWDRQRVLVDSIMFAECIEPGVPAEVDIQKVTAGRTVLFTAIPTAATKAALQAQNLWPVGMCKLHLIFRPKNEGPGVYSIERMTGKRIYPDDGVRVWVNGFWDYLCQEIDRHIIAWPVEEPSRKDRDPKNEEQPYTYKQQRQNQFRRGGQGGRRDQRGRRDSRRGGQRRNEKPKTVRGTVTFQPKERGDGIVAFDEKLFEKNPPILPAWGHSFLVGAPMECDLVLRGRIVVATPVKGVQELTRDLAEGSELYTAPAKPARKDGAKQRNEQPKSRVDQFRERHGDSPTAPQASDKSAGKSASPSTEVHDGTMAGQLAKLLDKSTDE